MDEKKGSTLNIVTSVPTRSSVTQCIYIALQIPARYAYADTDTDNFIFFPKLYITITWVYTK